MSKNDHLNKSSANRKRKRREKRLAMTVIFALVAVLVLFAASNWEAVVGHFEGIGERTLWSGTSDAGFPVRLPGSAGSIDSFDNGFMLLTETYVYTYGANGGQRFAHRHGYSTAKAAVSGRRILVYDKNGRQFSLFGRSGLIYENDTDERIVYANIGENGSAAVVFRSDVHANVLEIYDNSGNWRYTKRFADENIMQVAFISSDNDIIVTTVGFDSGNMTAAVRRLDTSSDDESGLWRAELPENTIPFAIHVRGRSVFVLGDSALFVLDSRSGELIGSYEYRGNLIDYVFSDNGCVLLVNDFTAGEIKLISLGRSAELLGSAEVSQGASQVEIHRGNAAVLEPDAIALFEGGGRDTGELPLRERLALSEGFSRFAYVRGDILLLGYNTVERLQ